MATNRTSIATAPAPTKTRRSPAQVALENALKASRSADEAKAKALWLGITSALHSAIATAETRDPIVLDKTLSDLRAQLHPLVISASAEDGPSSEAPADAE